MRNPRIINGSPAGDTPETRSDGTLNANTRGKPPGRRAGCNLTHNTTEHSAESRETTINKSALLQSSQSSCFGQQIQLNSDSPHSTERSLALLLLFLDLVCGATDSQSVGAASVCCEVGLLRRVSPGRLLSAVVGKSRSAQPAELQKSKNISVLYSSPQCK